MIAILLVFSVIIYLWFIKPQLELTQVLNSFPHYQGLPKFIIPEFNLWESGFRWRATVTYRITESDSQKVLDYYDSVLTQRNWQFEEESGWADGEVRFYSNDRYLLSVSVQRGEFKPPHYNTDVHFSSRYKEE